MKYLAIDVVLLPPKKVSAQAVKISRQFANLSKQPFPLNNKDNFPHISLFFGVVRVDALPVIQVELKRIVKLLARIPVIINKLNNFPIAGEAMYFLDAKKTAVLKKLQKMVITKLKPFTKKQVSKKMFCVLKGEQLNLITCTWVRDYLKTSTGKKFSPHITLRTPFAKKPKLPIAFNASALALCQLGDKCTCRKILFKANLK